MEIMPRRQDKWKKESIKRNGRILLASFFTITFIFIGMLLFFNKLQTSDQTLHMLLSNLGSLVVAVGISFPAILIGIFQVKYPELDQEEKMNCRLDLIAFIGVYCCFIVWNSIVYLCQNLSFFDITFGVAFMLGGLIGFLLLFVQIAFKMLILQSVNR